MKNASSPGLFGGEKRKKNLFLKLVDKWRNTDWSCTDMTCARAPGEIQCESHVINKII